MRDLLACDASAVDHVRLDLTIQAALSSLCKGLSLQNFVNLLSLFSFTFSTGKLESCLVLKRNRQHNSLKCQLKGCCRLSRNKHNTLLAIISTNNEQFTSSMPVSLCTVSTGQVLLCTAVVEVVHSNVTHTVGALLDTGSQSSFVTDDCKKRIRLTDNISSSINICGIVLSGKEYN